MNAIPSTRHHEILPSVIEALRYFGALSPTEIEAKLALRGEIVRAQTIATVCEAEITERPGGFSLVRLVDAPGNRAHSPLNRLYKA